MLVWDPAKDSESTDSEAKEAKYAGAADAADALRSKMPYVAAITLAEAESIRRIIHQDLYSEEMPVPEGMGGLPTLEARSLIDSGSSLALLDGNGRVLDKTPSYLIGGGANSDADDSAAVATHLAQCVQVLRFYNNEMYYTPPELKLLLQAMGDAPVHKREGKCLY